MRTPRLPRSTTVTAALLAGAAALALGCSDSTGTDGTDRAPDQLNVVTLRSDAPAPAQSELTFWAKAGVSQDTALKFSTGEDYARFKLGTHSLLARPDGTPILPGDSVQITIRIVDPAKVLFEMQPAGLKFNPVDMAELRIRYDQADDDFDHNGQHDAQDDRIRQELSIWRQETLGAVFEKLGVVRIDTDSELRAQLSGFSRYAIAY
jgi:hypothetical protein